MSLKQFIKQNKEFWWYVKDPLKLDDKSIVEGTIRYGDMKEIRQLMKILGANNVARIFARQIRGRRVNYDARTVNYFKMYFKRHASQ